MIASKIDEKIAEAMKLRLVGDFVFTEDELDWIYNCVRSQIRNRRKGEFDSFRFTHCDMVFVAVVNKAKQWDSSKFPFWEFLHNELGGDGQTAIGFYNYIHDIIKDMGDHQSILYLDDSSKQYYATILAHAFAPKNSTNGFFDLCWRIFSEDMEYEIGSMGGDGGDSYHAIAKQLQKRLGGEGDKEDEDFCLAGHIYTMRAGIKGLAAARPELVSDCIQFIISCMDKFYRGVPVSSPRYLFSMLKDWWEDKEKSFGADHIQRGLSREKAVREYSSIKPRYVLAGSDVILHIPPIRLRGDLDENPSIKVVVSGDVEREEIMETYGSGLSMATKAYDLDISGLDFSKSPDHSIDLSISITHMGSLVYASEDQLKRQAILFHNGHETNEFQCEPGNYDLFLLDDDLLYQYPSETAWDGESSCLLHISADNGETLQFPFRTITFTDETTESQLQFTMKQTCAALRKDGQDYAVVDGDLLVSIEENENGEVGIGNYGIKFEGSLAFRLADFPESHREGVRSFSITEVLKPGEPQSIVLFRYSDGAVVQALRFVKFNDIRITYDRPIYFGDGQVGRATFQTNCFKGEADFGIDQDEVSIGFPDWEIILYPPVLRWRIGDGAYSCRREKPGCYYENLPTNTTEIGLSLPPLMGCKVMLDGQILAGGRRVNSYKLGEAVYAMAYKATHPMSLDLKAVIEGGGSYLLTKIYLEDGFETDPVVYDPDRRVIEWKPEQTFVGGNEAQFCLVLLKGGQLIKKWDVELVNETLDCRRIADGFYILDIYRTNSPRSIFGSSRKKGPVWSGQICFGNPDEFRFDGKDLLVNYVHLPDPSGGTGIKPFRIDDLRYIGKRKGGNACYSGNIYFVSDGRRIYLKKDCWTGERVNPIMLELKSNHTCWINYGYGGGGVSDFESQFMLGANGEITTSEDRSEPIEYFHFKELDQERSF